MKKFVSGETYIPVSGKVMHQWKKTSRYERLKD